MAVDEKAVIRLIEHHVRLGVDGVLLAGTCGEGPWMPANERRRLVRMVSKAAAGRLRIAVQVSDNSAARILENAEWACEDGAELAAIAPPSFLMNASPEALLRLYREAIRRSPLPVCVYDMGVNGCVRPPNSILGDIYREERVVMIKDSSTEPERRAIALEARRERSDLRLFNGDEFSAAAHMCRGYDGLMLGGAVFNGVLARRIMQAVIEGDRDRAEALQERMSRLMYAVYGGENVTYWLAGLKHLLVEMGIFSTTKNFLNYQVTRECAAAIQEVVASEQELLLLDDVEKGQNRGGSAY